MKQPCAYLLASKRNGTRYIGVTSDLIRRVLEHKQNAVEGFTKKYGVHMLVWFEMHEEMLSAIAREKGVERVEARLETGLDRAQQPQLERFV